MTRMHVVALLALAACHESAPADPTADAMTSSEIDEPTTLVTGLDRPNGIAVDDESVYWVEGEEGAMTIQRHDLATGETTQLGTSTYSAQLSVSGDHVYWTDAELDTVYRAPRRGGEQETVVSDPDSVVDVAIDGERMYWVSRAGVRSALLDGTDRIEVAVRAGEWATDVFVDDERVLWTAADGVFAIAKTGGAPVRLADQTSNVIAGGGRVYMTMRGLSWQVIEADADGSNPVAIQDTVTPGRVIFEDGALYWGVIGDGEDNYAGPGGVWTRDDDGEPVEIVAVPHGAVGLAVHDDLIFYTEMALEAPGEGAIWAAPR